MAQRSIYLTKHPKKGLKKYSKVDCRAFATSRDIPNFGPFWVVKIQGGGQCPPGPPDKNIPVPFQSCVILTSLTSSIALATCEPSIVGRHTIIVGQFCYLFDCCVKSYAWMALEIIIQKDPCVDVSIWMYYTQSDNSCGCIIHNLITDN